jgi:hypothetical protein
MTDGLPGRIVGEVATPTFVGWELTVDGLFEDEMGLTRPRRGQFRIDFGFEVARSHCEGWPIDRGTKVEVPYVELTVPRDEEERLERFPALSYNAQVPASREAMWPAVKVLETPKRRR